jgi:hypothetical protein
MDAWAWEQLQPWLELRRELPVGPLSGRRTRVQQGAEFAAGKSAYERPDDGQWSPIATVSRGISMVSQPNG